MLSIFVLRVLFTVIGGGVFFVESFAGVLISNGFICPNIFFRLFQVVRGSISHHGL